MNPFTYHNPTRLHFGKGQIKQLTSELPPYGKKVLLVYGGGSIKKNGLYDEVMQLLGELGAEVTELAGVEPNPRLTTVKRGVALCREHNIDFILAVGGGSVIDCTKAIAAGARFDGDPWDFITAKAEVTDALPFGTVLTLAATGSEMNPGSVITNWETKEKYGWGSPHVYPRFSILDPVYTFTVPRDQTVYGIVDMMSHVFESYFHHTPNTPLQDRFCESILKTVIQVAPRAVDEPENYELRETLLLCGTTALNGTLSMGLTGDWATHRIEHAVSAIYDIPHAGGLAILFPNWMTYTLDANVARFKQMAVRVFDVDPTFGTDREIAQEGIKRLRQFWSSIGAPSRLADYGIDDSRLEEMAVKTMDRPPVGKFKALQHEDVLAILKMSL